MVTLQRIALSSGAKLVLSAGMKPQGKSVSSSVFPLCCLPIEEQHASCWVVVKGHTCLFWCFAPDGFLIGTLLLIFFFLFQRVIWFFEKKHTTHCKNIDNTKRDCEEVKATRNATRDVHKGSALDLFSLFPTLWAILPDILVFKTYLMVRSSNISLAKASRMVWTPSSYIHPLSFF